MKSSDAQRVTVTVDDTRRVSGLLRSPAGRGLAMCWRMGPGPGWSTRSWRRSRRSLKSAALRVLRYQFPYMEAGGKRTDPPKLAQAAVRAAVAEAARLLPGLPLIAGGKSFGGRMTSQAQAAAPLAGVRGLAFLGFPSTRRDGHRANRGDHLFDVHIPMLFLQGTRDALAELSELEPLCEALGGRANLRLFQDADHSFHVPARSGRTDREVRADMLDAFAAWGEGSEHSLDCRAG